MNILSHKQVTKKVNMLLSTLKKTKISKRFSRIVSKLSKLIVSEIEPIHYILKGNTLNKTYAEIINLHTKIKIKSIKINNNNRNNIIIIPVHVDNKVTGNSHLILFIYNTRNKFLFSLDPSDSKKTKITELKLFQAFKTSRRFIYRGIHKYTRILRHHGLCRFATPLLFKYNVKLNNRILKKEVIKYFEYLLN